MASHLPIRLVGQRIEQWRLDAAPVESVGAAAGETATYDDVHWRRNFPGDRGRRASAFGLRIGLRIRGDEYLSVRMFGIEEDIVRRPDFRQCAQIMI